MKVLFISNYPAPYRVEFFNLLGKEIELTVVFLESPEQQKHRSQAWFTTSFDNFNAIFSSRMVKLGKISVQLDIVNWIKKKYDHVVMCGYSTPTMVYAIKFMQRHKIQYSLEADGAFLNKENIIKQKLKKKLISHATRLYSTGQVTDEFFIHYGMNKKNIVRYKFSSLSEADVLNNKVDSENKYLREQLRSENGFGKELVILTIGQMIHRKGFDLLIEASNNVDQDHKIIIIGGKPNEELRKLSAGKKNIIFLDFMNKDDLRKYYLLADIFVFPTREDIWGLVINEAMSFGLPIVATDKCGSALELIENNVNGIIVPANSSSEIAAAINRLTKFDTQEIRNKNLEKISEYTIEKMVKTHVNSFMV